MIITDENSLRIKCEPVLSDEFDILREKLETVLEWSKNNGKPGVGLACPQIGIAKNMAIVRVDSIKIDLVNSNIVQKYHQCEFPNEGCLSFPNKWVKTRRYKEIVVKNNLVYPNSFIATDFIAIIVQHEWDHLRGVLLPDVAIND